MASSGYAGVPPGALSAWLSVRDANQQADLRQRQGMLSELQIVGGLQKMQQEQIAQEKLKQFQAEIAAATTPEQKIAVATKYGAPKEVLQYISASKDRAASLEAANVNAGALRDQRTHEITMRGEEAIKRVREQAAQNRITREEADRREAGMRENMTKLAASLRPEPVSERVVQDTGSPTGWSYEDARTRVRRVGAPVPSGINANIAGGRESVYVQRMMMGANQASKDLANVVQLPLTASTGIFGGRRQGAGLVDATKEILANKATAQEAQAYNAMATGFQRSLAQIESAGLMPSGSLTHQMDAVLFKEGDTNLTKLHKLAQTRQIVEAGMEVIEANPRVTPEEKSKVKDVLKSIRASVPFTHSDLIQLQVMQESNPGATLQDVITAKQSGRAPKEGDKQTSKSGKPMVFRQKRWEYE